MKNLLKVVLLVVCVCRCGLLDSTQLDTIQPDSTKPETTYSPIVPSVISARIYQKSRSFPIDSILNASILFTNENRSEWAYYHKYYSVGSHGASHATSCTLSVKIVSRWTAAGEHGFEFSITDSGTHTATNTFSDPTIEPIYESGLCTLRVNDTSAVLQGGISSIANDALYAILCHPMVDSIRKAIHADSVTYNGTPGIHFTYFGELEIPTNPYLYYSYLQGVGTIHYYASYENYYLVSVDGVLFDSTNISLTQSIATIPAATTLPIQCSDISAVNGGVYSIGGGSILFSSDGKKWNLYNVPAGGYPEVLFFLNENTGWFIGKGFCGRTDDGGKQCKLVNLNYDILYSEVIWIRLHFVDEQNGFCVGKGGQVLATTDGGETWSLVSGGPAGYSSDLSFPDKNNVWVTGSMGPIYHTKDAGESWDILYLPKDTTLIGNEVRLINFLSAEIGYSVGGSFTKDLSQEKFTFFRTADGGKNWSPIESFEDRAITALLFLDDKNGLLGFKDGTILYTTDSGNSWSGANVPLSEQIDKIKFSDNQNGWVLTEQGKIMRTSDAGHNWSYVSFDELITE